MTINRLFFAYLDESQLITILLPYSYYDGHSSSFHLADGNGNTPLEIQEKIHLDAFLKYVCYSPFQPKIGQSYSIIDQYGGKTDLQIGAVIRTSEFDESFYYDGSDLGVTVIDNRTMFKVWAPTASQVKLVVYDRQYENPKYYPMMREEKGVWRIELGENLDSYPYSFLACINQEWREAVDPYARAVTVNGQYGVVVHLEQTKVSKPQLPEFVHPCDAIIYETHIRDLSAHPASGVNRKGTYLGAAEIGTTSPSGRVTGLSYIKDLGVTHIEFLPFHDFEGVDERYPDKDYNWGYNPVHFNVPEGSYASNPEDPYRRIIELKELIATVHAQGLRVIMDAVYNHVYVRENSPFEKLVPGYYFRHGQDGLPSNGTGVGNDFASEKLMARKFILDSIRYWLTEYQVDGFRFDLMGILDIQTMLEVKRVAQEIDPSVILIGEGWDLNTPIEAGKKATIGNQAMLPCIGQFNDWFRDSIKGSTFNLFDRGYALGNERYTEAAKQVLAGSVGIDNRKVGLFSEPRQSVNYVECHDNHTLWDKLVACEVDFPERKHRLATSLVLLAQGIPFIHSGQEFFRTKNGVGNSYKSPDEINWLDWERRDQFIGNVDYIKGLIAIRKSHRAFRLPDTVSIRKHVSYLSLPAPLLGYCLLEVQEYGKWKDIYVLINPTVEQENFLLPEEGEWKILANHLYTSAIPFAEIQGKSVDIEPYSLMIIVR
ncbi:type I pullulanase [Mesobacillus maritimus]|uniref:type I pullulanase n=1 Tax=Mesobacillus maritimus TaxID=1643336 RepID=UPI0020419785|nr:type I pullulanase [Mesobacillus maritimus]MCM3670098.1 type I pullulanase [Mesobacillus maritimus]